MPEFVEYVAETLDIGPGTEVFEVACGAGEFLLPLHDNGFIVGGMDADPALIAEARETMPGGRFVSGSPAELDPAQPWQVVVCRAFGSFPDVDYARGVLARMAAKATHAVAILDLPEGRFDRRWILRAFAEIGVSAVQMDEARVEGDGSGESRFHAFARM
ncbi:MAG: methyltransferase domain-containing protein [Vicinamibacterales bacterium]